MRQLAAMARRTHVLLHGQAEDVVPTVHVVEDGVVFVEGFRVLPAPRARWASRHRALRLPVGIGGWAGHTVSDASFIFCTSPASCPSSWMAWSSNAVIHELPV